MSNIRNLTVLGGGLLGGQIAWHSAFTGKNVTVYDIDAAALEQCRAAHESYAVIYLEQVGASETDIAATDARLRYTTDLAEAAGSADLVIEAVPEVPEIKTRVYESLAPLLPAHTVIASNSSTLLPSDFAAATGRPEKFCALHFGNGIWVMNFAEIMPHPGTDRDTLLAVTEFAIEIGMVPLPVAKEQNGYLVNTWFVALTNAAQTLVTNGIGTAEDVDRSFMIGGRTVGPMAMLDQVGLPLAYDVYSHWGAVNGDAQMTANAEYIKENFLDKGLLGAKSGQGYYTWPNPSYAQPGFLDAPDISEAPRIVDRLLSPTVTPTR